MFTVTKDALLPTSVVGSWPRPAWFTENLDHRSFSSGMNDLAYREQFIDATATVAADQQWAGLDILTNGDYHLDNDWSGRSWLAYPVQRFGGMTTLDVDPTAPNWAAPNGTYANEIHAGWRFPRVIGKIEPGIPLEFAKIWRVSQSRAVAPVKFCTCSASGLGRVIPTVDTDAYDDDDRKQLTWDMAELMNKELRELADAGCRVIQIDDPPIKGGAAAAHRLQAQEEVEFAIDVVNRELEGLEDVEVWLHICWGSPGAQGRDPSKRVYTEETIESLFRVKADVLNIESKSVDHAVLPFFKKYKGNLPMKIAPGFVSHRTTQVESVTEVADEVRAALEFIDAEDLILASDCGFGRQGVSRSIATYKAAALAQAADIVRQELGGEARDIPAARADRQIDPSPLTPTTA